MLRVIIRESITTRTTIPPWVRRCSTLLPSAWVSVRLLSLTPSLLPLDRHLLPRKCVCANDDNHNPFSEMQTESPSFRKRPVSLPILRPPLGSRAASLSLAVCPDEEARLRSQSAQLSQGGLMMMRMSACACGWEGVRGRGQGAHRRIEGPVCWMTLGSETHTHKRQRVFNH